MTKSIPVAIIWINEERLVPDHKWYQYLIGGIKLWWNIIEIDEMECITMLLFDRWSLHKSDINYTLHPLKSIETQNYKSLPCKKNDSLESEAEAYDTSDLSKKSNISKVSFIYVVLLFLCNRTFSAIFQKVGCFGHSNNLVFVTRDLIMTGNTRKTSIFIDSQTILGIDIESDNSLLSTVNINDIINLVFGFVKWTQPIEIVVHFVPLQYHKYPRFFTQTFRYYTSLFQIINIELYTHYTVRYMVVAWRTRLWYHRLKNVYVARICLCLNHFLVFVYTKCLTELNVFDSSNPLWMCWY